MKMQFTTRGLKDDGFLGFRTLKDLDAMRVPRGTGIFAVLRPDAFQPAFLKKAASVRCSRGRP